MTTLIQFLQNPLAHAFGWSLLHFCWQGAAVAILLASVLRLLRGGSPQLRYITSCCALALMVVLPLVTFARLAAAAQAGDAAITVSHIDRGLVPFMENGFGTPQPWLDQMAGKLDSFVPWIISVWLVGVILLMSRLNLGLFAAHKMKYSTIGEEDTDWQLLVLQLRRRLGVARTVKLVNSAVVQVPTVIGWLRPVILIPIGCLTGLSAGQVEAVFAHELAHIRRQDYLVSVLQSVVETLLFYHPAVWWVSHRVRQEREACCDDLAVRINGDSLAYAKALSVLAERRASLPMIALGANGGILAMRIRRLLGYKESPSISRPAAVTLAAVVIVTTGFCIGMVARASSQQMTAQIVQDLSPKYQQWLNQDVVWIITPEERAVFLQLQNDDERDGFETQFWEHRNPTPGSPDNKFKEEHYRRLAYANAHFAASIPGWETDRGRIYILYGPPDELDARPAQGSVPARETWLYHSIREYAPPEKVQVQGNEELKEQMVTRKNVTMTFVDSEGRGNYRLQSSAKD